MTGDEQTRSGRQRPWGPGHGKGDFNDLEATSFGGDMEDEESAAVLSAYHHLGCRAL
jgi:hypothetical protein